MLIAFILQIWGINFGLPYIYNPDEPVFTNKAVNFFTGDFNPHWFGHPGAFLIDILFLLYGIYFIFGLVLGHFTNLTGFLDLYKTNPTNFYLIGRFLSVIFATLSIYIIYKIVVLIYNQKYALMSAIIIAVAPLYVSQSKLILTNIPQTMLILFTLYYFIRYLESKNNKDIYIGCIFFGVSVATKWTSILLLVPLLITLFFSKKDDIIKDNNKLFINIMILVVTILIILCLFIFITKNELLNPFILKYFTAQNYRNREISRLNSILKSALFLNMILLPILLICFLLANLDWNIFKGISNSIFSILCNRTLWIGLFIMLISFFVMAPFVFFDFFEAMKSVLVEARTGHFGASGLGFVGNILFYIKETFNKDFGGIGLEVFSVIGILFLLRDWKKLDASHWVLFSFPFVYLFAIARLTLHWSRWAIPLFPFLAILTAIGLGKSLDLFIINPRYNRLVLILILLILLFVPFRRSVSKNWILSQKDTRTVAKEWIESNLPENSVIAYEKYSPHLHVQPKRRFRLLNMGWTRIVLMPLDYYIDNNVDYIIITSAFKDQYYDQPKKFKKLIDRYELLESRSEKIRTFTPSENQPGPIITIYKISKDP